MQSVSVFRIFGSAVNVCILGSTRIAPVFRKKRKTEVGVRVHKKAEDVASDSLTFCAESPGPAMGFDCGCPSATRGA